MVITTASFEKSCLKEISQEEERKTNEPSGSKSRDAFYLLEGIAV